ncbi:ribokinase [Amycolatopsis antarctica]|uniref:Ribokinase n=1 Tax=Amycolatopsis antarctica TaxID=1854586 RepID=A0A263D1N2_9PSEU|nr:ribokinase [Amycolatopsis antarctica]
MLLAGLCTVDVVQRVEELPEPGVKVRSSSVAVAAGGPATNAAVTVAALGGTATLVTVLGGHPLAGLARADLAEHGVNVHDLLPGHAEPPAVSAVVVRERDGERTVVSHNAGAVPMALPDADPPDPPGSPDAVLVDGHHPELALRVARRARAAGVPVVLDAGSWKPVFDELLPLVDIAACSAQFRGPDPHDRGVATVITTAGADPVRWSSGGATGEVGVPAVRARDTLGAGDVWHGALAFAVARSSMGASVPELIGFANSVAAERVRHAGPRAWVRPVRGLGR